MPPKISKEYTCPLCCSLGVIKRKKTETVIHKKKITLGWKSSEIPPIMEEIDDLYIYECKKCNPPSKYYDISDRTTIKQDIKLMGITVSVVRTFGIEYKRNNKSQDDDLVPSSVNEKAKKKIFRKIKGAVLYYNDDGMTRKFKHQIQNFKNHFKKKKVDIISEYIISVIFKNKTLLVTVEKQKIDGKEILIAKSVGLP